MSGRFTLGRLTLGMLGIPNACAASGLAETAAAETAATAAAKRARLETCAVGDSGNALHVTVAGRLLRDEDREGKANAVILDKDPFDGSAGGDGCVGLYRVFDCVRNDGTF